MQWKQQVLRPLGKKWASYYPWLWDGLVAGAMGNKKYGGKNIQEGWCRANPAKESKVKIRILEFILSQEEDFEVFEFLCFKLRKWFDLIFFLFVGRGRGLFSMLLSCVMPSIGLWVLWHVRHALHTLLLSPCFCKCYVWERNIFTIVQEGNGILRR